MMSAPAVLPVAALLAGSLMPTPSAAAPRARPLLTNATARSLVIQSMIEFAVDNSLQGVNLDIEGNPNGTAAGLTSFVCELRRELRARLPGAQLVFDAPSLPTCYHSPRCNATIPDVEDVSAAFPFSRRSQKA